ncbi:41489_t:CDS:2 [Gigaspora margarita]|uniref:41489_t:CDS:1 n=1 Tax=Gigaspora margarita TaxID=4874 RepID=A0ABN7VCE7_GIGMA|nr:41489_t:CDS:2 [Gigaspora margarita]
MQSEIPENINEMDSTTRTNDIDMIDITPSEPIQRTPEEIEEKRCILEQVEYYFGDKNFPKDKFLNELCSKDPERCILYRFSSKIIRFLKYSHFLTTYCMRLGAPLVIVRQFNKMQVYKNDELIVEALRESPEILEVDDSGMKIRRNPSIRLPIPDHITLGPMWKSIYAVIIYTYLMDSFTDISINSIHYIKLINQKGFDTVNQPSQESVANFFNNYGQVVQIKPRKDTDQKFKGSYFIQFEAHEEAKSISEKELHFNDVKLIIMMMFDYCEMKCVVKGMDRDTMRKLLPQINKKANSGSNPCFDYCEMKCVEKGMDIDTMCKLPLQIKKEANSSSNPKLEPVTYTKNCLLRFEGAGPKIRWKDIKAKMMADYGKVKYVKLDKQPRGGIIEFGDPIALQVSSTILNSNLDFGGIKPVFTVLQGEDEENYYLYKRQLKREKRKQSKNRRKKKSNVQRKVEGKNDAGIADCSSTSVEGKNDAGIADCSSILVVGNKNKLDDTTEAEKSSASKPKPDEIVVGNKCKHDTTEVEMSPEIKSNFEEAVVGKKFTEVEMSPAIKQKLEETVIGNKRKHDTTETEMSSEIKLNLEETVMGNKRRPDDTIEAEMSPAIKPKLEETVIGNKRKLDTTEAEMSPAFKLKLEEIVTGNKRKLDDTTEVEKLSVGKPELEETD